MIQGYCHNCGSNVGFKRNLGWGTFFGSIMTGGLLLLIIPFYPKRCIKCGKEYEKDTKKNDIDHKAIADQNKSLEISKYGISPSLLTICSHCGKTTRADAQECLYCHMFLPTRETVE